MKLCKCGICELDCEYHKPEDKPTEQFEIRLPTVYINIPMPSLPSLPVFNEWWNMVGFCKRMNES